MSGLIGLSQLFANNRRFYTRERRRIRCNCCYMIGHTCSICDLHSLNVTSVSPIYEHQIQSQNDNIEEQDITCKIDPDDQQECPICLNNFDKTNVFIPKCGHKICGNCFFENIRNNKNTGRNCSLCRQVIIPNNVFYNVNTCS